MLDEKVSNELFSNEHIEFFKTEFTDNTEPLEDIKITPELPDLDHDQLSENDFEEKHQEFENDSDSKTNVRISKKKTAKRKKPIQKTHENIQENHDEQTIESKDSKSYSCSKCGETFQGMCRYSCSKIKVKN